jgi:hypothetical protein
MWEFKLNFGQNLWNNFIEYIESIYYLILLWIICLWKGRKNSKDNHSNPKIFTLIKEYEIKKRF